MSRDYLTSASRCEKRI